MYIASVKRKALLKYMKQISQLEMELEGVRSLGKQWTRHNKQVINPSSPGPSGEHSEVGGYLRGATKDTKGFSAPTHPQAVGRRSENIHHLRECRSYFCVSFWSTATAPYSSLYPQQRVCQIVGVQ